MPRGYRDNGFYQGSWYKTINPNEHTYTPGYGFSPRPPAVTEQRLITSYAAALGAAMLGFYLLNNFVPYLIFWMIGRFPIAGLGNGFYEIAEQVAILISMVIALLVPFLLYSSYIKIPQKVAAPNRPVPPQLSGYAVLVALGVGVVASYCIVSAQVFFSFFGILFESPSSDLPINFVALALYAINMTVIPAIFEEYVFRGVIMQSLRRFGDGFALFVSAVLFAFVHLMLIRLPNAFILGLVIGYFVMFTGSLKTGVMIHLVHNMISLVFMLADDWLGGIPDGVYYLWEMTALLLGIVGLMLLMRRYSGLFALRPSDTINTESCKLRCFWCTPLIVIVMLVTFVLSMGYVVVA